MKKIINSADKKYVPVDTENLVLDDTPTEGSFNAVTSDGVAKAIAGGGGGTEYSAGLGISIGDGLISAKVDGTTIDFDEAGFLQVIGGGGSYTAGPGINIDGSTISAGIDNSTITTQQNVESWVSTKNDYSDTARDFSLGYGINGTDKCDWTFGAGGSWTVQATAAQEGCKIRVALYDSRMQLISLCPYNFRNMMGDETLVEGSRTLYNQYGDQVRPSGRTFSEQFPLESGWGYGDVSKCALVAYDEANSQIVGDPLTLSATPQLTVYKTGANVMKVTNPLPGSLGSAGQVLTVNGNADGIEWATPSGGGSSYSAGAGIAIDGNGAISVVPDSTTVKVERRYSVYATKDSFYGRMSFSDTLLGTATTSSTCTFSYGLNTDGAAFKIGCDPDQVGYEIRVEIGNDSSFTKSVISTVSMANSNQTSALVTLTDTATILEGYGLSFYRSMMSPTYTFSNTFDWSEYTFDEIFGNTSVYVRLRAWDSGNSAVVGNPLTNPTSTGATPYVSANMSINSDAIPQQVMVKFGNASYSGLTTNSYGLAVANPVPAFDASTDAGKVLQVQNDGTLAWVTLT